MSKKIFAVAILLSILYLFPHLVNVGHDISNSDAARWHRRSIRFLEALKARDFAGTYQHYQPGVTLMWLDALNYQVNGSWSTLENTDAYVVHHRNTKTVLAFVLFSVLLVQVYLVSQLFGGKVALFYGFFMSTEPYLTGIDRWVHLTSLETYFSITAVLAFFMFLKSKKIFLVPISGAFLGLAVLSKLTSLMILPFLVVAAICYLRKNAIKPVALLGVVFAAMFVVGFPAMWVDPLGVIFKLFNSIKGAVVDDIRGEYYTGVRAIIYYFVILIYKLSPLTLGLLLLAMWKAKKVGWPVFLFIYILTILTLSDKKIDRYSIFMFPSIILCVSIYFSKLSLKLRYLLIGVHLCVFYWATLRYCPVFSAYYSPVFGGEKAALDLGYYENSGEYYAQASFYLNSLGRDKVTFIPDNYESVSYYYNGGKSREFGPIVDYVLSGVDFDRKSPKSEYCPLVLKTFGPSGFEVVTVFGCRP